MLKPLHLSVSAVADSYSIFLIRLLILAWVPDFSASILSFKPSTFPSTSCIYKVKTAFFCFSSFRSVIICPKPALKSAFSVAKEYWANASLSSGAAFTVPYASLSFSCISLYIACWKLFNLSITASWLLTDNLITITPGSKFLTLVGSFAYLASCFSCIFRSSLRSSRTV